MWYPRLIFFLLSTFWEVGKLVQVTVQEEGTEPRQRSRAGPTRMGLGTLFTSSTFQSHLSFKGTSRERLGSKQGLDWGPVRAGQLARPSLSPTTSTWVRRAEGCSEKVGWGG